MKKRWKAYFYFIFAASDFYDVFESIEVISKYVSKEAALDAPTTQLKTVSQRKIYFHKRSIDNSMDINPAFPLAYYDDVETGLLYNPKPSSKPKSKTESRNVAQAECEDQEKFLSDICHKAYYNKVGLAKHIELKFHLR